MGYVSSQAGTLLMIYSIAWRKSAFCKICFSVEHCDFHYQIACVRINEQWPKPWCCVEDIKLPSYMGIGISHLCKKTPYWPIRISCKVNRVLSVAQMTGGCICSVETVVSHITKVAEDVCGPWVDRWFGRSHHKNMQDTFVTCMYSLYTRRLYHIYFFIWIEIDEGQNHPQVWNINAYSDCSHSGL